MKKHQTGIGILLALFVTWTLNSAANANAENEEKALIDSTQANPLEEESLDLKDQVKLYPLGPSEDFLCATSEQSVEYCDHPDNPPESPKNLIGAKSLPESSVSNSSEIDKMSAKIIQKEIELLRLNTQYKIEQSKTSKWKIWRQFAYNLGLFGTTNAGIDHISIIRWENWRTPGKITRASLKAGPILLLTGHSIAIGGIFVETGLDAINELKLKRKKLDSKSYRKNFLTIKKDIDDMLISRKLLIEQQPLSNADFNVLRVENDLMSTVRDNALFEYATFRKEVMARKVSFHTGNLLGFSSLATGGYIGSLMSLIAVANRKPRLAGSAGIGFIISGALIPVIPVATKYAAKLGTKYANKSVIADIGIADPLSGNRFDKIQKELVYEVSNSPQSQILQGVKSRLSAYEIEGGILDRASISVPISEKKAQKRAFAERLIINTIIGGTKLAYGVQLANAGFGYKVRPPYPSVKVSFPFGGTKITGTLPKPRGAAELFSHRVAQAATTFIPGTGLGLVDTVLSRFRQEVKAHKMKKKGIVPGAAFKERLDLLNQAEASLL